MGKIVLNITETPDVSTEVDFYLETCDVEGFNNGDTTFERLTRVDFGNLVAGKSFEITIPPGSKRFLKVHAYSNNATDTAGSYAAFYVLDRQTNGMNGLIGQ